MTVKEVPTSKEGAIYRSVFLIPGAFCTWVLAVGNQVIITSDVTNTIRNLNTTDTWTETISSTITLQDPIWISIHFMLFFILVYYEFWQVMNFLGKKL